MTITTVAQDGRATKHGCLQGEAPRAKLSVEQRRVSDSTMELGVSYRVSRMSHQVCSATHLCASPDRLFVRENIPHSHPRLPRVRPLPTSLRPTAACQVGKVATGNYRPPTWERG